MKQEKYDNSGAYQVIARLYDKLMGDGKYPDWEKLIREVAIKYQIKTGVCLDIACGTGNISRFLVEAGFKVVGVDASTEMIAIAGKKLPSERFVRADIRDFDLGAGFTAAPFAVSFYDSLNYLLSDKDMLSAFLAVSRHLKPGGIFLFDMNPMDHVAIAQKFRPRVFKEDDWYSVFQFGGKDRFWTLDIDLFTKEPSGLYRLDREQHVERGYNKEHILPLLEQAGFAPLEVREQYKVYEDGEKHLSRLYFITKKQ